MPRLAADQRKSAEGDFGERFIDNPNVIILANMPLASPQASHLLASNVALHIPA